MTRENHRQAITARMVWAARSAIAPYLLAFMLCGCTRQTELARQQWPVMGTVAALQVRDGTQMTTNAAVARACFREFEAYYSDWCEKSVISAINRAAGTGQAVTVADHCTTLLQATLRLTRLSEGAFNPLMGAAMHLWGFRSEAPPRAPSAETVAQALELAQWREIEVLGEQVMLTRAGMRLDLGAIAKGFAVDHAWQRLRAAGATNLLIDLGGNLRALGTPRPIATGWRTGIRNPFDTHHLAGYFELRDGEATATSGSYERFIEIDGRRYSHILDGRSGYPVHGYAAVTVVAPDATTADGLSTALFVLGPQRGLVLLAHYPGSHALWIPDTPQAPTLIATPELAQRIHPLRNFQVSALHHAK